MQMKSSGDNKNDSNINLYHFKQKCIKAESAPSFTKVHESSKLSSLLHEFNLHLFSITLSKTKIDQRQN